MQPSLSQSYPESDLFSAETFHCSQDSFNPNSQSIYTLTSTQEELTSPTEQFSSFEPKRNISKSNSALRNAKKKVRFADDQFAPLQKDDASGDFDEMPQIDLNATCPVDFGILDSETSFESTPPSQQNEHSQNSQQTPNVAKNNGSIFTNKNPNVNNNNNNTPFLPTNGLPSENKDASNPNYTYIMREMVVKKQDNLVSYTYQKSYHDNQLNSSIEQSVHMNDDVIPNNVLFEQKEQVQDLRSGDLTYKERRAIRGLGAQRFPETFARKDYFDAPDSTYQFFHHGNQMHSQEFDTPSYQSSQHSEFGNPMTDSFSSEYLPSSQHSYTSHHDDEFVPNELSELRIKSNNFANTYPNNFETISDSDHSKRSYSSTITPTRNSDDYMDNSRNYFSPESSLEFTPIISKLRKQLSLESSDLTNISHGSKISDLNYL